VALDGSQSFEFVGVPFGSHARLILLYLQTEALRTGSREVELGGSMRAWLFRVGIPAGGTTGKSVRDQAERISRCKLTFDITTGSRSYGLVQQTIVDKALFIEADEGTRQGGSHWRQQSYPRGSSSSCRSTRFRWKRLRSRPYPTTLRHWTPTSGLPTVFTSCARTSWSPGRR
jgi:Plasmid encoded RepA protein